MTNEKSTWEAKALSDCDFTQTNKEEATFIVWLKWYETRSFNFCQAANATGITAVNEVVELQSEETTGHGGARLQ